MKAKLFGVALFGMLTLGHRDALSAEESSSDPKASASPLLESAQMAFLRDLTRDVVAASRVGPGKNVGGSPTNTCGFVLIMPGGHGGYPAFWVRDFAMSLGSGFVTADEMLNHLRLIARCQNGSAPRRLKHGLVIPPFAIPDHITFNGGAVFYPGTYSAGDDQGTGTYGILPPADDHYEFIHIAYRFFRQTGRTDFLKERISGMPLSDRLAAAFNVPRVDDQTGMVTTDEEQRMVGFGFCDAIYFTGQMLFPSLLRHRAAGQLAELAAATGNPDLARRYRQTQEQISTRLAGVFGEPARLRGWLMAATKVGRQPDVWGTLYALHLGALKGDAADRAAETVEDGVRQRTIVYKGAVRHVPKDLDASPASAWEKTAGVALNTYQNGAYWHTPTGWLIETVRRRDPQRASQLLTEYLDYLREHDFRRGPGHEAPWECFGPNGYAQNGVYMTSVTLPWAVLSDLPNLPRPEPR